MESRGRGRGPASPPAPYTRKLSGPQAKMSDTWVASLWLLGLLAGPQQVSLLGGKGIFRLLFLWVRGLLLTSDHHLPLSGSP